MKSVARSRAAAHMIWLAAARPGRPAGRPRSIMHIAPAALRFRAVPTTKHFDAASSSFGATNERNAYVREPGDAMLPRSQQRRCRRPAGGCSLIWCRARRHATGGAQTTNFKRETA